MSKQQVTSVLEVKLTTFKLTHFQISATGQVPTSGWSNPELVPYVYIQAPPDGIYDFDFVAEPPKGPVQQVLAPISVKLVIDKAGVKGVRIHAATNSLEARPEVYEQQLEENA